MNEQTFVDRILETENLTDGLDDTDANWLLDWGIGHLHNLIGSGLDTVQAGVKVNDLMAVMRKINQITADRQAKPAPALAEDIALLKELAIRVFGPAKDGKEPSAVAGELAGKSTRDTLKILTDWAIDPES